MYFDALWRENRQKRSSLPVCHPAKYCRVPPISKSRCSCEIAIAHGAYLTANFVRDISDSSWIHQDSPSDDESRRRKERRREIQTRHLDILQACRISDCANQLRESQYRTFDTIDARANHGDRICRSDHSNRLAQERNLKYREIVISNNRCNFFST